MVLPYLKGNFKNSLAMKTKHLLVAICIITFFYVDSRAQAPFQVIVKGKGDPILLFPGFGCTGDVWDETVAALSKTNECHIFTFAGFGNVPPIGTPWLPKIKDGIIDYVKERKLKKPILLGHSLGGTLSLWLATLEKGMFKKVIVVDALPGAAALMIPGYTGEIIPYDNPRSKMMLDMDSASFSSMNAQSVSYMCLNKEKQPTIVHWMNSVDRKTYVYGYVDMLNLDLRKEIAGITIPVIILAASQPDIAAIQKTYQSQYANLPAVTIRYADHSAHFVMYDQPEWFITNVREAVH